MVMDMITDKLKRKCPDNVDSKAVYEFLVDHDEREMNWRIEHDRMHHEQKRDIKEILEIWNDSKSVLRFLRMLGRISAWLLVIAAAIGLIKTGVAK